MPLFEAVRLALATIRAQKLKSSFTLLGVTIGVMFLIAVVSIVEGMSKYMEEDFAGRLLGVNTFTLHRFPWFNGNVTEEMWREWQRRPRIYYSDLRTVTSVLPPGTRYAVESQDNVRAISPYARVRQVDAHAVDGDYFTIKHYDLTSGRTFTQQELQLGTTSMVIGSEVASYFFPNLDPLGRELKIGGIPYTIIGVIARQGTLFGLSLDKMVIAPYKSPLHRLTNPKGDVDGILVQSPSELAMNDAMEQVREVMRGQRHLRPAVPDNFAMETSQSALTFIMKLKRMLMVAGTALPAIGLVVGGLVIMNIMLVAVAERTREIGIRKALGAKRRDILSQFLVEAATLSTLGAVIGIVAGAAIAFAIAKLSPLPTHVALWSVIMATLLGTTVGVVAGVYPASRASRLDPIAALRQE
ncbi:MAG: FtsX-like permease family protein [Gemmatimonadaceae bacterium]|nr:FtsX-like permease family protein [Gemmatimonadaceae bacterium]NUQ92434.1 FtsX-like permease family protein [Gemmatimonadaceae bacterium]NUR20644.1 FtsX-like permease family protein [Gemmatimonadaceae bacterium]NUS98292.1 FtsX-like permease family protein [Gemmatimonadaceae bacterium]